MLVWGMKQVSAGHVGGTRGSGIVSSAADMLGMRVVQIGKQTAYESLNIYLLSEYGHADIYT